jgi:hypothetical protein
LGGTGVAAGAKLGAGNHWRSWRRAALAKQKHRLGSRVQARFLSLHIIQQATMLHKTHIILALFFCVHFSACADQESPPPPCPNTEHIGGDVKIDGDQLLLHKAFLYKLTNLAEIDPHEIIFEVIDKDCTSRHRFRFYATVSKNSKLQGEFEFLNTNVYTLNKITSFAYDIVEPSTPTFTWVEIIDGKAKIFDHGNNEYTIEIQGQRENGQKFDLRLTYEFK